MLLLKCRGWWSLLSPSLCLSLSPNVCFYQLRLLKGENIFPRIVKHHSLRVSLQLPAHHVFTPEVFVFGECVDIACCQYPLKVRGLGKAPTLNCLISAPMKAVLSEYTFLLKACIDVWCQHYVDFETIDYQIIIKKIVLSGKVFQATFMVRYEVPYNIATDAYTKITDKNP